MSANRISEGAGTLLAVYPSRLRSGLLIGVGFLLVVAAFWMAWDMRAADWQGQGPLVLLEAVPPLVRSPVTLLAAFLISGGLVLMLPLLLPGPFATLDENGIVLRSRFAPARFAWADLDGITVTRGRVFVGLITARKADGTIARKWIGIPVDRASNVTLDDLFSVVTRFRPDIVSRS
jgi:hypothetical protein